MGVTRIIPPGKSLVFVACLTLTVTLALNRLQPKNLWIFLAWIMTGLGLILTFKRNLWIVFLMALFLLAVLSWWKVRFRIIAGILFAISVGAIVISPVFSQPGSEMNKLVSGTLERLVSLTNTQSFEDPNSSLHWRDFEYGYALPTMRLAPLHRARRGRYVSSPAGWKRLCRI